MWGGTHMKEVPWGKIAKNRFSAVPLVDVPDESIPFCPLGMKRCPRKGPWHAEGTGNSFGVRSCKLSEPRCFLQWHHSTFLIYCQVGNLQAVTLQWGKHRHTSHFLTAAREREGRGVGNVGREHAGCPLHTVAYLSQEGWFWNQWCFFKGRVTYREGVDRSC